MKYRTSVKSVSRI